EVVSRAIDTTHERVMDTTEFIQRKVIEPARELAAILAGVRRGLEVLVAPAPSPINRSYGDEEMFIGWTRNIKGSTDPSHRRQRARMVWVFCWRCYKRRCLVRQTSSLDRGTHAVTILLLMPDDLCLLKHRHSN